MGLREKFNRRRQAAERNQRGIGLVETLIAVAVLGTAVTTFIVALSTGMLGIGAQDEGRVSQGLAQSQMEYVKSLDFVTGASSYPPIDTPSGYEIQVSVASLPEPADADIQLITVEILRDGQNVLTLDGYKVNR